MFNKKSITIFGGTGTIGMLIVEALLQYDFHSIRIFSNDENSLWKCERKWGNDKLRYLLGDIRDFRRVKRAIRDVNYVFNCAAIKHVPFAEYNPLEAVNVNIYGLENIIEACLVYNIEKLLHISTDKAIRPTSIMGMTKGIGEQLCRIRNDSKGEAQTLISCIRLGNVWESRGSLVKIIEKCVREYKPIPVTDIRMERYFIKQKELQDFILKVFNRMKGGEIYIPKLKNYKIIDIIKDIAGDKYPITIIGRRKGEKLKEKLITKLELEKAIELEDMWVI